MLRRIARRFRETVAEANHAQHRVMVLAGAPDRWVLNPNEAPDTYQEFMFRTSGPLLHEPTARRRARGRSVR
jgi:hypothetical protein